MEIHFGKLSSLAAVACGVLTAWADPAFGFRRAYSDHMVFQQGEPIVIEGTSSPGVGVRVELAEASGKTLAYDFVRCGASGVWRVTLPARTAGGPFEILASGECGTRRISDVMVGELWLCSGQSNMEMPVWGGNEYYRLTNGLAVAAAAKDPLLRLLKIPRTVSPDEPSAEIPEGVVWKTADAAENVMPFSSCGYYFGLELRRRLGVAVGLVDASWGGSRIEPWIPTAALKKFGLKAELDRRERDRKIDLTLPPPGRDTCALKPEGRIAVLREWMAEVRKCTVRDDWHEVTGPSPRLTNAVIVAMEYPFELKGTEKNLRFAADGVCDTDEAFVDGTRFGGTDCDVKNYWLIPRSYAFPQLAAGRHVFRLEVFPHVNGGHVKKPRLVWDGGSLDLDAVAHREKTLAVPHLRVGQRPPAPWDDGYYPRTMPRFSKDLPSSLYNAMVAPLANYRFKGVIWYQGCSNSSDKDRPRYPRQQQALARGLRDVFQRPDMPFLAVALAGFESHRPWWAYPPDFYKQHPADEMRGFVDMRERQKTIREVPRCDIASAVDIGLAHDVHPKNKAEVARRLSLLAMNLCYGGTFAAHGPEVASVRTEGNTLRLVFDPKSIPGGLVVRGPFQDHEFRIAGADGKWAFATAEQKGNDVILSAPNVKSPVKVRYGWESCPAHLSLFNRDAVAALPFEAVAR